MQGIKYYSSLVSDWSKSQIWATQSPELPCGIALVFLSSGILLYIRPLLGFFPVLFPFLHSPYWFCLGKKHHNPFHTFFISKSASGVLCYFRKVLPFTSEYFIFTCYFLVLKSISYAYRFPFSFLITSHHFLSHALCYFLLHLFLIISQACTTYIIL